MIPTCNSTDLYGVRREAVNNKSVSVSYSHSVLVASDHVTSYKLGALTTSTSRTIATATTLYFISQAEIQPRKRSSLQDST